MIIASVVVPSHGGAHRLGRVLDGLAAQVVSDDWEVVLVIDGVVDDSSAVAAAYADRLPLRVVVKPDAQGVAAALTSGFSAARGQYLIRCDDDLDVGPGLITGHVTAHAGRTDRVVLALTRDVFPESRYAEAYGRPANGRALADAYAQPADARWQHLAACFSIHATTWRSSGGFDDRFAYGEDSEFGYRLWRAGFDFVIVPALEVGHLGPAGSASVRVPRAFVSGASRRAFAAAHPEVSRPESCPFGVRASAWNHLVKAVSSTIRTHGGYRRLGSGIDGLLRIVPRVTAGRVIALAVEAAAQSGQRFGLDDLHAYRHQKDAELARERSSRETSSRTRTPSSAV